MLSENVRVIRAAISIMEQYDAGRAVIPIVAAVKQATSYCAQVAIECDGHFDRLKVDESFCAREVLRRRSQM